MNTPKQDTTGESTGTTDTTAPAPARKPRKAPARKRGSATKRAAPAKDAASAAGKDPGIGETAETASRVSAEPTATGHCDDTTQASARQSAPSEAPAANVVLLDTPMTVRWRDLDAFNHVNNSKYLSYLEEARLRWMLSVPGQGLDDGIAPVVAAAHLNYRRPIEWPAEIAIELYVERLGNTSLSIGHRIVAADDRNTLYCDGYVVMVWIDRSTGQAAPLPAAVRAACAS